MKRRFPATSHVAGNLLRVSEESAEGKAEESSVVGSGAQLFHHIVGQSCEILLHLTPVFLAEDFAQNLLFGILEVRQTHADMSEAVDRLILDFYQADKI